MGSAHRSKPWREACEVLVMPAKRTMYYTPRTTGKAEPYDQTLSNEWLYCLSYQRPEESYLWPIRYLGICNGCTYHMRLTGLIHFQQLMILLRTK